MGTVIGPGMREDVRGREAPRALATANSIIARSRMMGRWPTLMQVQSMAILAHGWSLALLDDPVFRDGISVHRGTPSIPSIHHALRGRTPTGRPRHPALDAFDHPEDDDPARLKVIREIVRSYGGHHAYTLARILRDTVPGLANGTTITDDELREAFRRKARDPGPR